MNLSTKNLRFDHVVALQKTLKKCPLFAYNRSMGILRRSLHVGIFLFALCASVYAGSKTEASQMKREALIADAKKYIGSPYVNGATGPESFDCSGFIYFIARKSAKVQLPRSSHAIYRFVEHISDDEIEAGDLLFFSASSSGRITHVGLYIGNDKMIHAASDGPKTGVIVSSRNERYWKTHYVGAGRFIPSAKGAAGAVSDNSDKQKSDAPSSGKDRDNKAKGAAPSDKNGTDKDTPSAPSHKGTSKIDTAKKKSGGDSGAFIDNFYCSFSAAIDWSLFKDNAFDANFRGACTEADVTISKWPLCPGIGTMIRGYEGGAVFVPLMLVLSPAAAVRIYAGLAVALGAPTFLGERMSVSAFPGVFGISFCTPSLDAGSVSIRFTQDISYTVFKKRDGSMPSSGDAFCAGFAFATGIRVSLPMRTFCGKRGT